MDHEVLHQEVLAHAVPSVVQEHRGQQADEEGQDRVARVPFSGGEAHDQSGCPREHCMRERRHDTAEDENPDEVSTGIGGGGYFAAKVEDVLRESESGGDGKGENDAVHRSVKVLARCEDQDQQTERFGEFLHDGGLDRGHEVGECFFAGGGGGEGEERLDEQRPGNGNGSTPGEGEPQEPLWFGLPAIDHPYRQQHHGERYQGGNEADDKSGDAGVAQQKRNHQEQAAQNQDGCTDEQGKRPPGRACWRRWWPGPGLPRQCCGITGGRLIIPGLDAADPGGVGARFQIRPRIGLSAGLAVVVHGHGQEPIPRHGL